MPVRLHPVDSEDISDLIVSIESDFGIRFSQDAFDDCQTVGEVFYIICEGLPEAVRSGGKCPSLMVFHMLKSHISSAQTARLGPYTSLKAIDGFSYVNIQRHLRRRGWKMPSRHIHPLSWGLSFAMTLMWICGLAAVIGILAVWSGFAVWYGLLLACHRLVFTQGYPLALSLGELATQVSHDNAKKLLSQGASFNRRALWKRFQQALSIEGAIERESALV